MDKRYVVLGVLVVVFGLLFGVSQLLDADDSNIVWVDGLKDYEYIYCVDDSCYLTDEPICDENDLKIKGVIEYE